MKNYQKIVWSILLFFGGLTQMQAQCLAVIYPDTSTCPVQNLYGYAQSGAAPFTYVWSNGVTVPSNTGLQAGTYYLTITDATGCSSVDSFTILGSAPLFAGPTVTDATCGNSNGAIDITIFGGSGAYQVDWYNSSGQSFGNAQDLLNIPAGTYYLYIQDLVYGCYFQQGIPVNNVGGSVTTTTQAAGCGQNNGIAVANATGFTNPTYLWSNGANTATINNLPAGTYTVTVSDLSCSATATAVIGNSTQIWASLWGQGCPASSLQAYAQGGSAPYTFLWSNGSSATSNNPSDSQPVTGLGTYSVTIVDGSGCSESAYFTVYPAMSTSINIQDASCANNDGAINLTVTGGDGNYIYVWSNGEYTQDLSNLNPGVYSVQVYDSTGCYEMIDSIVVGGGGNAFVNGYAMPANCNNTGGFINQAVTGLNNPTYIWNTGATTSTLTNLAQGWYGCTISDASGCVLVRNYYVGLDSSCYIHISGYVYNVSASSTCTANGAYAMPYVMVRLLPSGQITFTNANGFYDFGLTTAGNYSVEYVSNSGLYTVLCPTGNNIAVNGTTMGNNYPNNNFFVSSPNSQDLSIYLGHYSTVSPGFGYWTNLQFCNNGQIPMSGNIDFTYDAQLNFDAIWSMSSTGSPVFLGHNTTNHLLTFSFNSLQPGECGYIYVDFLTPTTLPLGAVTTNTVSIYPLNNDATPANNTDSDVAVCVGSWDPNEKLVGNARTGNERNGGDIYVNDNTLDYTIHFQNLGTAPAQRVVVRDVLEANLLAETVRNVQMSHNGTVTIENGNELVFTFENIMLPAASFDAHGSNGYIKFTLDRVAGLPINTSINNDAAIYFDFNTAVITNINTVTIAEPTAVKNVASTDLNANVFPNPFQDQMTLRYDLGNDSDVSIYLFDALGSRIHTFQASASELAGTHIHQLQTGELVSGIYFLSVETSAGRSLHKIVKQ